VFRLREPVRICQLQVDLQFGSLEGALRKKRRGKERCRPSSLRLVWGPGAGWNRRRLVVEGDWNGGGRKVARDLRLELVCRGELRQFGHGTPVRHRVCGGTRVRENGRAPWVLH